MNRLIFGLLKEKLEQTFSLPKYNKITIDENTIVDRLPWTPARYRKFKDSIEQELQLNSDYAGTLESIVADFSQRYTHRFFSEIWKPRTDEFTHTGWKLVEEINKLEPKSVLDVGCGYHPFKGRINNLIGIDPYNDLADYQVDILEYKVRPKSHDVIIALGSINFNSKDEIEERFAHCVSLLTDDGSFYLRVNPGILHKNGPYVDIFDWSFEVAKEFEERYSLKLTDFKKDSNGRLYIVYKKL